MIGLKSKWRAGLGRSRLPFYFSFVVLLVVSTLILPIYWIYIDKLNTQVAFINDSLIDQVQKKYDGLLQEIDRTSIRLAENINVNRFIFLEKNGLFDSEEEYQRYLKEMHGIIANEEKFYANINNIYLFIHATQVVVTSDSVMPIAQFPDEEFVRHISEGGQRGGWSDLRTTDAKYISGYPVREEVVTLHRHLTNDGLVNDATLFIDVKKNLFGQTQNLLSAYPLALLITGADKRLIFAEANGFDGSNGLIESAIADRMDTDYYYRSDAHSSYNDWNYSVIIPKQSMFALTTFISRLTFALSVGVLLFGLTVSIYFSRRFHRPLEAALSKWRGEVQSDPAGGGREKVGSLQEAIQSLVSSTQSYADFLEANRSAIRNAMLADLLKNNVWPSETRFGLPLNQDAGFYQVITCVLDESVELNEQDKGWIQYAVFSRVREAFMEGRDTIGIGCEIVPLDEPSFGILLYGIPDAIDSVDVAREIDVVERLGRIQDQLRPYPQFAWTFGIGSRYEDANQVSQSYRESQLAVQNRIYRGKGSIISFSELHVDDSRIAAQSDEWVKYKDKIVSGIRSRSQETAEHAIHELCDWMGKTPGNRLDRMLWNRIHYMSYSVFTEIEKLIYDLNLDRQSIYPKGQSFAKLIESDPTVVDIREMLLDVCARLIQHLDQKPSASKSSFIVSVCEYIRESYTDQQLSLESTASRFGMNPSYLGQLMKKELNRTFLQLLSEVRIEQAKRLLMEPSVQIQDVAANVGYGNRSTFIRMFKSHVGVTPSDYRNRLLLEGKGELVE